MELWLTSCLALSLTHMELFGPVDISLNLLYLYNQPGLSRRQKVPLTGFGVCVHVCVCVLANKNIIINYLTASISSIKLRQQNI